MEAVGEVGWHLLVVVAIAALLRVAVAIVALLGVAVAIAALLRVVVAIVALLRAVSLQVSPGLHSGCHASLV